MDYTKLMDFTGKVILISGASRGIGEAVAHAFAANGGHVIVSSRRQEACDAVAEAIVAKGGAASAKAAHVGHMDQLDELVTFVEEKHGKLDVLVNCGGTNPHFGPAGETSPEQFDKTIDVNLKGPYFLTSKLLPLMIKNGGGSVVNIASINGMKSGLYQGIYSMTKAALISMTQVFAKEYGAQNIRVNAVCPGLVETKMTAAFTGNDAIMDDYVKQLPVGRWGQPDDMVAGTLFLASEAAGYTTGTTLVMDGGYLA